MIEERLPLASSGINPARVHSNLEGYGIDLFRLAEELTLSIQKELQAARIHGFRQWAWKEGTSAGILEKFIFTHLL